MLGTILLIILIVILIGRCRLGPIAADGDIIRAAAWASCS